MVHVIGIDLGTTYSAVGVIGVAGKPEILPNREGERITPSVVFFQGDQTLVGSQAKRSAPTSPDDVVQFVKRQMGEPDWRFTASDGAEYSAEQVSAIILRRLKEDAEAALGEPVTDAVITVPAFFDDARRKATKDAGLIAGLNVRRIINEPTAAALAYGLESSASGKVLVYDLGGGTFDVTVMNIADGVFDVIATSGDRNLGGFDWDNALMEYINEQIIAQGGPDLSDDDLRTAELRDKAELAKRALTTTTSTKVFVTADGKNYIVQITREKFEEITRTLLSRTCDLTESTLDDADLDWSQIDQLLLVGGSTHMPMVKDAVARLSGKTPERSISADEAVALGAAVQAHLCETESTGQGVVKGGGGGKLLGAGGQTVVINDVTAHGLGSLALEREDGPKRNYVIIKPNSRIPAKGSDDFETLQENQPGLLVEITEGDESDPEYVTIVGTSEFKLPKYPKGAPIRISIAYDIDAIIFAEVFDLTSGKKLGDMEIERKANMTKEQLEAAIKTMRKIEVN